jgi:hypothetical protein
VFFNSRNFNWFWKNNRSKCYFFQEKCFKSSHINYAWGFWPLCDLFCLFSLFELFSQLNIVYLSRFWESSKIAFRVLILNIIKKGKEKHDKANTKLCKLRWLRNLFSFTALLRSSNHIMLNFFVREMPLFILATLVDYSCFSSIQATNTRLRIILSVLVCFSTSNFMNSKDIYLLYQLKSVQEKKLID